MTASAMPHVPDLWEAAAKEREQRERPSEPPFVRFPVTPLEARYVRWYAKNPGVFAALERAALRRFSEGATRLSVAKLFEDLREDPTIDPKGEGYKMDNSKRSYTARHLMWRHLELDGLFETRPLTNHKTKREGASA